MRTLLFVFLSLLLSFNAFSSPPGVSERRRLAASRALDVFEVKTEVLRNRGVLSARARRILKSYNKRSSLEPNGNNSVLNTKPEVYLSGGGNSYHIGYREIMNGSTLDKDTGTVNGCYFGLGYSSGHYMDWFLGAPYLEAYFRYSNGKSTYDGRTSGGTPLTFKEDLEIERFGLKIGAKRYVSDDELIYGYFDMGKRVWIRGSNRIINGALDYREKYRWLYFGFGAGVRREITSRIMAGLEGELMFTPRDERKMYAELYDGAKFSLGGVWGVEIKAPLRYAMTKRISFDVTPYYTFWHIGESSVELITSGGIPVGYAVEPESKTYMYGVLLGLTVELI